MKKLILINVLLLQVVFLFGQNSLQLFNHDGEEIINNHRFEIAVDWEGFETVTPELFVKNISAHDIDVVCRREVVLAPQETMNNFCYGLCFGPNTDVSPAITVPANTLDDANVFSGHYQDNDHMGVAQINYVFYDKSNGNDQIKISVVFYGASMTIQNKDSKEVLGFDQLLEVEVDYANFESVTSEYILQNTTNAEIAVICKRNVITNVENTTNNFCYGMCFGPGTDESPAVVIPENTLDEENIFSAHYQPGEVVAGTPLIEYTFVNENNEEDFMVIRVAFRGGSAVGIAHIDQDAHIIAYPNPATTQLSVDFSINKSNAILVIYNAMGAQVISKKVNQSAGNINISTEELPRGLYFYRFENDSYQTITQKIVLQ